MTALKPVPLSLGIVLEHAQAAGRAIAVAMIALSGAGGQIWSSAGVPRGQRPAGQRAMDHGAWSIRNVAENR